MDVTLDGLSNITSSKFMHFSKQDLPIDITDFGIITFSNEYIELNALSLIVFVEDVKLISFMFLI